MKKVLRAIAIFFTMGAVFLNISLILYVFLGPINKRPPTQGKFKIVNKTAETITALSVSVCDLTFQFDSLERGKSMEVMYFIKCEGGYTIDATLASGKKIKDRVGYLMTHSHQSAVILLADSGAKITDIKSDDVCTFSGWLDMLGCLFKDEYISSR